MKTETASSEYPPQHALMLKIAELKSENDVLKVALNGKRELLDLFDHYGDEVVNKSILAGLRAVSANNNVWQAVNAMLRNAIRNAKDATTSPGISDQELRTAVGRMSSLEDFHSAMAQTLAIANKEQKDA